MAPRGTLVGCALVDPKLIANDGLHPSGEQYRRWADATAPVIEDPLRN
jgi:lysophospholipase L1-like esterase